MNTKAHIDKVYEAATHNFDIVMNAKEPIRCGCFHCKRIFASNNITDKDFFAENDGRNTVACPFCGIDSVIVESDEIKVTAELVSEMNNYAFHGDDEFAGEVQDLTI